MAPRQWAVSAFIVAFLLLKAAEALLRLESWPLTHVPMFSWRMPPEDAPWRVTLLARSGDRAFELVGAHLGLSDDELVRRLYRDLNDLPRTCSEIGRLYDARQPPGRRLDELVAHVEKILRPGVPAEPDEITVSCLPVDGGG